jgi:hypothetical protein
MTNKTEFIGRLAERLGADKRSAATALDAILDEIYAEVAAGEKVTLGGFGSFEKRSRNGNPDVVIPAFRAGAEFKAIATMGKPSKNGRQRSTRTERRLPGELPPTEITTEAGRHKIEFIERKLVADYAARHGGELVPKAWTIGSTGERIECDIFDAARNEIVEAKAGATRWYVRMALGQLLDYRRHEPPRPNIAVLLPELPNKDLQDLLIEHGVTIIYQDGKEFVRR